MSMFVSVVRVTPEAFEQIKKTPDVLEAILMDGDEKAMAQPPQRLPGHQAQKPYGKPDPCDEGSDLNDQAEATAGRDPAERGIRGDEYKECNSRTAQPAN